MLLEKISSPKDLRKLALEQLPQVAAEIRERIIEVVSRTGGHLASSLGAVELIIALHYCLDTPRDKIIFDVGHQAYAHKILTGRNKDFVTCGHSSNAVSLALGLASARDYALSPGQRFKVAAVIGDGSLSGGLCFEGLNNTGHLKKDIMVILNTNEMSIAPNVGAISTYLNKIISLPIYNRFKDSLESFVKSRLPKGDRIIKLAIKFEENLKGLFIPGMLFEELGFRYFGPFDGHNLHTLIPELKNILTIKGPRLVHVVTKKGKGYYFAESDPVKFHGTGPFDLEAGAVVNKTGVPSTYTEIFGRKLVELSRINKKIVAITAAMPEGTGLDRFRDMYPERFFDVGIAEAHAVSFSAGLAKEGLRPVVALYSTFLQRAYDQIIEDVALQNLPVVFAVDRAGIVGEDGVTHQGIFDISFLRTIPNLVIMAPKDGLELEEMLEFAFGQVVPVAIRYPRDKIPNSCLAGRQAKSQIQNTLQLGRAEVLREGKSFAIIACGSMVLPALEAAQILEKEGLLGTVINARFIKPLDAGLFRRIAAGVNLIFTAEEGIIDGGFGSAVSEIINKPVIRIGLPCEFIPHGKRELLLERFGLTAKGIAGIIKTKHG